MGFEIVKGEDLTIEGIIVLLYGEPGIGKTSTALTAKTPIVFDFDWGAHRSGFKIGKDIIRITNWSQIVDSFPNLEKDLAGYDTIVVDTVDTCLEYMRIYIEDKDYKLKTNGFKLYGKLKDDYSSFLKRLTTLGKNIILIAHATTEEQNGTIRTMPKITGSSRDIVRQKSDFMGYMASMNKKKCLDFNPTDYYEGKNSAGFPILELPDFNKVPDFFQVKLDEMRSSMNAILKSQDENMQIITSFKEKLETLSDESGLNKLLGKLQTMDIKNGVKEQLWHFMQVHGKKLELTYDKDKKTWFKPQPVAQTVAQPEPTPPPVESKAQKPANGKEAPKEVKEDFEKLVSPPEESPKVVANFNWDD